MIDDRMIEDDRIKKQMIKNNKILEDVKMKLEKDKYIYIYIYIYI